MKIVIAFLLAVGFLQSFAEEKPVSISSPGEALTTTAEEIAKRSFMRDEDAFEERFRRAASKFGGGEYSTKQQKQLLAAHNEHRLSVKPSSSNMNELLWRSKLAEQAQEWSNGCFYAHPDKRVHADYQGIGQNLFISWLDEGGDNPPVVTLPVDMWNSEVANFSYPMNTCRKGAVCGHYTQVVWAETTKVGCGIKFCRWARSSKRTFENAWLVTCNYSPAGNMQGEKPYERGDPCTACAKGFCRNNLCSKCKTGEEGCGECRDTDAYCGANPGYPSYWCNDERHSFVKEKCPAMCGVCEAGNGRRPRC